MKPYGAIEASVSGDLTQCMMDDANETLVKHFIDKKLKKSQFRGTLTVALRVSDLVGAMDHARYWSYYLTLKPEYEVDEWSVSWLTEEPYDEIVYWSSGA